MKLKFNIKTTELFSFICLFCFVFADAIKESPIASLNNVFLLFAVGAFGIQFILKIWRLSHKFKHSCLFILIGFSSGFLIQYFLKGDIRLIVFVMGIFSALWVDERSLVKYLFWANFLAFSFVMLTGGYRQINVFAAHAGAIVLLYICRQQEQIKIQNLLIIIVAYGILSLYTSSGSCIIALGTAVFLEILLLINSKITIAVLQSFIIKLWFPIVFAANYLLAICCNACTLPGILGKLPYNQRVAIYKYIKILDKFLSSRLTLGNFAINEFGVSFWGGNVKPYYNFTYKDHYFNLDSGMLWLLIGRGIVVSVLFLFAMVMITKYFADREKFHFVIVIIAIALWGMNEDILTSISMNFMLLFFGRSMIKSRNLLNKIRIQFPHGLVFQND